MSTNRFRKIAALAAALGLIALASGFADPSPGVALSIPEKGGGSIGVSSSAVIPNEADGASYGPENLLDGKLDTAWCPVDRVGAWVKFAFEEKRDINFLLFANGYQRVTAKGTKLFPANARVHRLRVRDSNGVTFVMNLSDSDGTQDWSFDPSSPFGKGVTMIMFTIESCYPGAKWQDILLSSLEFGFAEEDEIGSGG
jgi:hypothetical protein